MTVIKKSFYLLLTASLIVGLIILARENKPPQEKIVQETKYEAFMSDGVGK